MGRVPLKVVAYSGYRANERPVRFYLGGRKLEVVRVVASWREEEHDFFRVRADDGRTYVLRLQREEGVWELYGVDV